MYILDTITYEIKEASHNFSSGRYWPYPTRLKALRVKGELLADNIAISYRKIQDLKEKLLDNAGEISAIAGDNKPFKGDK